MIQLTLRVIDGGTDRELMVTVRPSTPVIVGGDPDCGLRVRGDGVGPRHGRFELRDNAVYYIDTSARGTRQGGIPISEALVRLNKPFELGGGQTRLIVLHKRKVRRVGQGEARDGRPTPPPPPERVTATSRVDVDSLPSRPPQHQVSYTGEIGPGGATAGPGRNTRVLGENDLHSGLARHSTTGRPTVRLLPEAPKDYAPELSDTQRLAIADQRIAKLEARLADVQAMLDAATLQIARQPLVAETLAERNKALEKSRLRIAELQERLARPGETESAETARLRAERDRQRQRRLDAEATYIAEIDDLRQALAEARAACATAEKARDVAEADTGRAWDLADQWALAAGVEPDGKRRWFPVPIPAPHEHPTWTPEDRPHAARARIARKQAADDRLEET